MATTRKHRTSTLRLAALLALACPAIAQAQNVFSVTAGGGLSNAINGCEGNPIYNGATPGAAGVVCANAAGEEDANGFSNFGHIGGSAHATTVTNQTLPAQVSAQEFSRSFIVFTSSDPTATGTDVSVNLLFGGILNAGAPATSFAGAKVSGTVRIENQFFSFSYEFDGDGTFTGSSSLLTGTVAVTPETLARGLLESSPVVQVPIGTPVIFELELDETATTVQANASARSDFSGSFKLPTGSDAFNLRPGISANADGWIVDNRFIDPLAVAAPVPEPEVLAQFVAGGLVVVAWSRRRLRRATPAST